MRRAANRIALRVRRPVQKGIRENTKKGSGEWGWYSTLRRKYHSPLPTPAKLRLGQQLFEEGNRTGVIRLTQPEDGFAAEIRIFVLAGDPDECRHTFFLRALREREHRRFPNLTILV